MKTYHRKWIGFGYMIIFMLICIIGYRWYLNKMRIEQPESRNQQINNFRKEINNIYIQFIEFFLSGETVLEWDDEELEHYHTQCMAMDNMRCRSKAIYPAERIDSMHRLHEDKKQQLHRSVQILERTTSSQ